MSRGTDARRDIISEVRYLEMVYVHLYQQHHVPYCLYSSAGNCVVVYTSVYPTAAAAVEVTRCVRTTISSTGVYPLWGDEHDGVQLLYAISCLEVMTSKR